MNDWWNDPPEESEPPTCPKCDTWETEVKEDGKTAHCIECDHVWELPAEPMPVYDTIEEKEMDLEPLPEGPLCPHGNKWGECDHCDFEGDIAFDAARERRMR